MKFNPTLLEGVYEVDLFNATDDRGTFVKSFHADTFEAEGLNSEFRESFYSTNQAGVIRGMHFQLPPDDHAKLVYATQGRILDVVLDLRKESGTYGQAVGIEISGDNHKAVYMPSGVAHGFCCLTEATMIYLTSTVHSPQNDAGLRWDSFDFDWPESTPIMSTRDQEFPGINEFQSPF